MSSTPDKVAKEIADCFLKPSNPLRITGSLDIDQGRIDGGEVDIEFGNTDSGPDDPFTE